MTLFWMLIIIAAVLVALGWIAYGIWNWRQNKLEEQMPKPRSERYKQAKNSMAEYAKKLAEFKKPTYKRDDSQPKNTDHPQG